VIIRLTRPAARSTASTAAALALATAALTVTTACGSEGASNSSPPPSPKPAAAGGQAFCGTARRFNTDQAAVDAAVAQAAHGTPVAQPMASAALRAARDAETTSATLPGLAPASLRAAVRTVTTTWAPFFAAVVRVGGKTTNLPLSAQESLRTVATKPAFQTSSRAVSAYEARACGLTPPHGH
jgi:hypothetical protein